MLPDADPQTKLFKNAGNVRKAAGAPTEAPV
jgi:hypothetical protein